MANKFLSDIELDAGLVDSNGDIGTSGQILSSTGSGVDWINAPSGTIDGSGTANNMVKWTSGTTVGNSLITDNGSTISLSTSGSSNTFNLSHTSGSGVALNITKGGNNEGLIVNKTSGSGNAVSITGDSYFNGNVGIGEETPLSDLHINNDSTSPVLRLSYAPVGGFGGGGTIRFQGGASDYVYGSIGWWNGSNQDGSVNYSAATRAMSFYANQRNVATNGYFRFYNINTEVAEINANGIYGNVFYDQGNTSYYLNPAGSSNLNTINVATINRNPTVTLSGDVSGSATMTNLGSININTTVANNSHQHNVLYENNTITYGASQLQWMDINGNGGTGLNGSNPQNPTSDWHYHLLMNHANSNGYYIDLAFDFHDDNVWFQRNEGGTLQGWRQMFHDGYHPNADTWTTGRTITIGNTGKSVNGSANVSWSLSEIGATPLDDIRSLGVQAFTGTSTTAGLISEMESDGAFDSYSSVFKTSWSYAANFDLTDAGRFTETAGTSWITWTDNSSDSTRGNITALAIAPNTGGSAGKVFIYNDQGSSYSPGWREVWTSTSDGSGSGLDADLLDGQHASAFASSSHNHDGDYVELTGDTMSGPLIIDESDTTDKWLFRVDNNGSNASGFWSASQDIELYLRDDAGNLRIQLRPDARSKFLSGLEAANLYDSDNTSYYVNPASTSVVNDFSGTRIWAGYDANTDNSVSCSNWFRSSGSTGWFNATYSGGIHMTDSTWVRVYNNKKFYNQNTIESNTAMYAPVFYDRNNTDYRFHGDQANDNVDLRTSGNYSIHVNGAIGGGHRKHNNLESPEMQWSVGGGTDLNWKKLCDIVVNDQTYSGYGAEIEITDFSGNFGNATYNGGELFKGALSIYHWGGSGTTPEIAYANIPYEMRSHVRWYKINETGQNRYQLQVKSPANYRELYVKVKPGIRNGVAEIISYANNTDGATSGGTAYASIQNADFNHEFAGDIWTNDSRSIGWKNIYGSPSISTYYGSISTTSSVYIGGPTGNGEDLYCDDLRSNKVYDRAATAYYFEGGNTGDSIRVAGDVVAYYSSDKRLKDNIKPIENALEKVNAISGVTFEWNEKSHKTTGRKDVGVVAQEVEEVFPEIVETRTNGYKAVDYQKLTAVLIESVKELTAKVEALEANQCNCK